MIVVCVLSSLDDLCDSSFRFAVDCGVVLCFDVFCAGRYGLSWFAVVFCCPIACAASQVVDLLSDVFVMVVV